MKVLFSELGVLETEKFHQLLLDKIEHIEEDVLTLDFSDVERIDLSNFQIIISLKKYCDTKDISLKLENMNSKDIKKSIQIYNLYEALGLK
ncbi:STAS domain-containing protein [Sulfurimonas sp.]